MALKICLVANTLYYPQGGGHRWVYLNWALGLRALGCQVIWLETVAPYTPMHVLQANTAVLKNHLGQYGLAECIALCPWTNETLPAEAMAECLDLDAVVEADLLLNLQYSLPPETVKRFRRSALVDIDPGLLQIWMSQGLVSVARHDVYFTIGETVGQPGTQLPDTGHQWHYTPPCIALDWWLQCPATEGASFTTVSHWYADEWMEEGGEGYANDKRSGFLPFLALPQRTTPPLELALCMQDDDDEWEILREHGWRTRYSWEVASTPRDYQQYIQGSLGEFSCVKPSCVRLQNAWISDRTLCYLASGKPVIVQHTGPSRFLPDSAGLFRFHDIEEAARLLEMVVADYEQQCRLARALAEEYFDARKVIGCVLERALP